MSPQSTLISFDHRLTALLLVGCVGMSAVALWRGWCPPLFVSLVIGLGLRVVVVYLAFGHTPHDTAVSFQRAGASVLEARDPFLSMPKTQWNFLPFSAYLFAAEIKTGLPWKVAGKLLPVACDVGTIALVGCLTPPQARRNAQLLYALSPLALLVSAWHGQIEPIAIALGLAALVLAARHRATAAGIALGLAAASKSWPLLFAPGVLRGIRWTRWWQAAFSATAVIAALLLSIPIVLHGNIPHDVGVILSYRSFIGTWGWTGVLRYLHRAGAGYAGPGVDRWQHLGTLLTAATLGLVLLLSRRRSAVDITLALLLAFLVVTAGFGAQYLLWPSALLYASRRRVGYVYLLLASTYAGFFYLYAFPLNGSLSSWPGAVLQIGSIPVIVGAVASLPWREGSLSRIQHRLTCLQTAGRRERP